MDNIALYRTVYIYSVVIFVMALAATYLIFHGVVALIKLRSKAIVNVFVSYQHQLEDLANRVADSIRSSNLSTCMIPFVPREHEHDQVIYEVLASIESVDVLLVIASGKKVSLRLKFSPQQV